MFKRLTAQAAMLALVAGILTVAAAPVALGATPAMAHSLMPNANYPDTDQMSDAGDGTTVYEGAHFTAVADPVATQVSWYMCPAGTALVGEKPASNCTLLGTDTSGWQASSTGPEGYDLAYDFTGAQEGTRDIVVQACDGPAEATTGPGVPANCAQDVESGIDIDDGDTAGRKYPTGEIVATCENGGCATPAGYTAGADNGELFPANKSIGIGIYTSPDTVDTSACLDTNPDFETLTCDVYATGAIFKLDETPERKRSGIFMTTPAPIDFVYLTYVTSETLGCGVAEVVEEDGQLGAGDKTQACVTSIAYGQTSTADPARAEASFQTDGATCREPGDLAERRPANPDEDVVAGSGDTLGVEGCLQDAVDNYLNDIPATFESSGVGEITTCSGTGTDTDSDGAVDRCTLSGATTGDLYEVAVGNPSGPSGDQTITFCADEAGDGCAGETVFDVIVAHWQAEAPKECGDGSDNDGDGKVDGEDPGCQDASDDSEDSDVQLVEAPSTLTIKYVKAKNLFKGKVGSGAPACITDRKVIVKKVGKGKIGTANASSTGVWKFKKKVRKGKYFAQVKQLETPTILCLAKKSKTIRP